jgi:hypothetical protein
MKNYKEERQEKVISLMKNNYRTLRFQDTYYQYNFIDLVNIVNVLNPLEQFNTKSKKYKIIYYYKIRINQHI